MSDRTLQDIIAAEIERLRGGAPIAASVTNGVVTLTGEAADEAQRRLIEQELLRLPEVSDVHNHLNVAPPPGDTRAQMLALLDREGVRASGLGIAAEAGVVTLSGQVEGWFDRDAAERLAWTLPGVRAVVNQVTLPVGAVEPEGQGDDPASA